MDVKNKDMEKAYMNLTQKYNNVTQKYNALVANNSDILQKYNDLLVKYKELGHVEYGDVACGSSDTWTHLDGDWQYKDIRVNFNKTYHSVPDVQHSVVHINNWEEHEGIFAAVRVSGDVRGFTLRCEKHKDKAKINGMLVQWISVPTLTPGFQQSQ